MTTLATVTITSSLEELRGRCYESKREFAQRLGVSVRTYDRMLRRDPTIQGSTMRQAAARLGVAPHLIAEFVRPASPERLAAIGARIEEANATAGWFLLEEDESLTPDPLARCLRGDEEQEAGVEG